MEKNNPKDQDSRTWAQWLREKAGMEVKVQEDIGSAEKGKEGLVEAGGHIPKKKLKPTKKR